MYIELRLLSFSSITLCLFFWACSTIMVFNLNPCFWDKQENTHLVEEDGVEEDGIM